MLFKKEINTQKYLTGCRKIIAISSSPNILFRKNLSNHMQVINNEGTQIKFITDLLK